MDSKFISLEKGLDILLTFDLEKPELSSKEISARLGIPLSSTYKYLDVLMKKDFIAKNPYTQKSSLGFAIFKLGNIFAENVNFLDTFKADMNSLLEQCGETVFLTTIKGWEANCVEKIEARKRIKFSLERGSSLPLHVGASSKILLAYQNDAFFNDYIKEKRLLKMTEYTITDPKQLRKEIAQIRGQGFAISDSEADIGAVAVAAPIFDHKGTLLAGLTVSGPRERMLDNNKLKLITVMVKKTARDCSSKLGYFQGKSKAASCIPA